MVPAVCSRSVSRIYPEMHVLASPQASRPYQLLLPSYFNFRDTQNKEKGRKGSNSYLATKGSGPVEPGVWDLRAT